VIALSWLPMAAWLACSAPVAPAPAELDVLAQLRARPLSYTHHARCRMGCRSVSEAEVAQLLVDGHWVPERTRLDGECPSHAVEGTSADGQRLRIVYAACDDATRVVTAIDLGEDHPCDCD
jgi:hypothetical protein